MRNTKTENTKEAEEAKAAEEAEAVVGVGREEEDTATGTKQMSN